MNKMKFLALGLLASVGLAFTACSDDKLGETIFDTHEYPLDRSVYTFPLDTFVKKNFLEPYNLKFIYKMEDVGSDMQKNLVPATYENSVNLAVLTKYLWYDVYKKLAGEEFLKENSPRIIHVIGSPGYNSDGSRVLGVAEGGLKVTLMEVNRLDVSNIDDLNELFFHTMHHEFGHILDQTHLRPTEFNTISAGLYDAVGWADKSDSIQAGLGFVTPYGSSQVGEDWVETLACYVTYTEDRWIDLLNSAQYDWEEVDISEANDYYKLITPDCDMDTVGYLRQAANYDYKIVRKLVKRDADGYVMVDENGNFEFVYADDIDGRAVILQKLDLVRNWLKQYWDVDLDALRQEVQTRQYMTDADGHFLKDRWGEYVNRLIQPVDDGSGQTLIEQLLQEVEEYKKLQTK